MATKIKVLSPKTLTDKSLPAAIAAYEKLDEDKFAERDKALVAVIAAANNLKKTQKAPDVVKYLTDLIKAAEVERKLVAGQKQKAAEAEAKAKEDEKAKEAKDAKPPAPDPQMLVAVLNMGQDDGYFGVANRSKLFDTAPPFKSMYDKGYAQGVKTRTAPPQTSMKPATKADHDAAKAYTQRKKLKKEYIQFLNKWWKTRLPENM